MTRNHRFRRLTVVVAAALATAALVASGSASAAPSVHAAPEHRFVHSLRDPYRFLPKVPGFRLHSTTVTNGRPLPAAQLSKIFGVPGGLDESPELSWSGFPSRTRSFVVSMYDPEAPTGSGFWHWVVADVPAGTTSLPLGAGDPGSAQLPAGAIELADDAGLHQYVGGAPPAGSGVHDYYLTVTALDVPASGATVATSPALLGFMIGGHTIARATIICPTSS